jgi:hypothetical protein
VVPLAGEELEPRLRRSDREEPLQDRGVAESFSPSGMARGERDFLEQTKSSGRSGQPAPHGEAPAS